MPTGCKTPNSNPAWVTTWGNLPFWQHVQIGKIGKPGGWGGRRGVATVYPQHLFCHKACQSGFLCAKTDRAWPLTPDAIHQVLVPSPWRLKWRWTWPLQAGRFSLLTPGRSYNGRSLTGGGLVWSCVPNRSGGQVVSDSWSLSWLAVVSRDTPPPPLYLYKVVGETLVHNCLHLAEETSPICVP